MTEYIWVVCKIRHLNIDIFHHLVTIMRSDNYQLKVQCVVLENTYNTEIALLTDRFMPTQTLFVFMS